LYDAIGLSPQHWSKWYTKNLLKNPFAILNEDWYELPLSGRTRDFALSIEFAKRLAMMARTERGEQVRKYFLECEAHALNQAKPKSQIDLLLESVQLLSDQEHRLKSVESKIHSLEAKSTTSLGYFSIAGFAALKKKSIDIRMASAIGCKAKAACRTIGAIIGNIPDPRFGRVNTYPEEILESVFQDYFSEK
jgi:phage anti-repressor protein